MIVPITPAPTGVIASVHRALYEVIATLHMAELEDVQGRIRVGEPHDYGMMNGKPVLLFYQTRGYSKSGGLPQWRHLDATSFRAIRQLEQTFRGGRATETGRHRAWDVLFIRSDPS